MRIAIIGGGAAGVMAGIQLAPDQAFDLYEKNEKLLKKLYITGKGRCNITNAKDLDQVMEAVVHNRHFLYSAFYGFSNQDMVDFLEGAGLACKVERGDRVFPRSDKASDVMAVLEKELRKKQGKIYLNTPVLGLEKGDGGLVLDLGRKKRTYNQVLVTTGGQTYPATGSTGDGYGWARKLGHGLVAVRPGLVGLETKKDFSALEGLALRNVELEGRRARKVFFKERGEMLFTRDGISGPLVLSLSSYTDFQAQESLVLDLKPGLDPGACDQRLLRDFQAQPNKALINVLAGFTVRSFLPFWLEQAQVEGQKPVHQVTQEDRRRLVASIKAFPLEIQGKKDLKYGIITQGGVAVDQVDPSTMESKLVPGLFFAGEILDLDALTGGYNLQIAWSTGALAGRNMGKKRRVGK